jgi:CDP-diacylglycerol--glycerol-3-phosphate 3-phosphatidyltransferase
MLANFFSILRIALIPFILYYLKKDANSLPLTALILLLVAILSDAADGYAARRFGQGSLMGSVLDPLADKLLIASAGFALVWWYNFPLWLMGMLACRDLAILAAGLYLLRTRSPIIPANRFGKYTTVCMATLSICYLTPVPLVFRDPLLYLAAVLIVISSVLYLRALYTHCSTSTPIATHHTQQSDSSKRTA